MEWIKCNLPWHYRDYTEAPVYNGRIDHDDEIRKLFGKTQEEMEQFTFGQGYMLDSPVWKAFDIIEKELDYEDAALEQHQDPNVKAVLAYRKHSRAVRDWYVAQPDVIAESDTYMAAHKAWKESNDSKSFTGRGLARSGTLMRVQVEDQVETHLIGTINELGGACDDCMGFPGDSIVLEYKVVYSGE